MWATLEKRFDPRQLVLTQFRPQEVWFELQAAPGVTDPVGVRWAGHHAYPAPTWRLDAPEWPQIKPRTPSPAALTVWWSPDQKAVAEVELERDADFQDPFQQLPHRTLTGVDGDEVVIEGFDVEDHNVVSEPGGKAESQRCLVVRLQHAVGKPVYVRVAGIDPAPAHVEHRFFTSVGRSTGLFWPVSRDQVRDQLKSLSLVSVAAFKREATTRGFTTRIENLVPNGIPQRPPAPIPLKAP